MKKSPYQIILAPMITERALALSTSETAPQYAFKVAPGANKIEIRKAIETIYKVKVEAVNTVRMKGKTKRQGRFAGQRPAWKKAFVILAKGQKLEMM